MLDFKGSKEVKQVFYILSMLFIFTYLVPPAGSINSCGWCSITYFNESMVPVIELVPDTESVYLPLISLSWDSIALISFWLRGLGFVLACVNLYLHVSTSSMRLLIFVKSKVAFVLFHEISWYTMHKNKIIYLAKSHLRNIQYGAMKTVDCKNLSHILYRYLTIYNTQLQLILGIYRKLLQTSP